MNKRIARLSLMLVSGVLFGTSAPSSSQAGLFPWFHGSYYGPCCGPYSSFYRPWWGGYGYASYYGPAPYSYGFGGGCCAPACGPCGLACGPGGCATGDCGIGGCASGDCSTGVPYDESGREPEPAPADGGGSGVEPTFTEPRTPAGNGRESDFETRGQGGGTSNETQRPPSGGESREAQKVPPTTIRQRQPAPMNEIENDDSNKDKTEKSEGTNEGASKVDAAASAAVRTPAMAPVGESVPSESTPSQGATETPSAEPNANDPDKAKTDATEPSDGPGPILEADHIHTSLAAPVRTRIDVYARFKSPQVARRTNARWTAVPSNHRLVSK